MELSKADEPYVARLRAAAEKGAKPFVAIYAANVTKLSSRDAVYYCDPCSEMIDEAVEDEEYDDAKLLLRAYVEHALPLARPNAIVLSDLGAKAIQTAIATDDDALFDLAQKKLRHKDAAGTRRRATSRRC
ncbi:MAG: hypothetical protein U0270_02245 [Labilithrix sp.]